MKVRLMKMQFVVFLGSRVAASALQALTFIALGRLAGANVLGTIAIWIGVSQFIAVISDFGMSTYLSKSRAIANTAGVRAAVSLNVALTICFVTIGAIAAAAVGDGLIWKLSLFLLVASAALEKSTETLLSIPIADGKKWGVAMNVLARRLAAFGFFLALAPITPVTLAFAIGTFTGAVIGQLQSRLSTRNDFGIPASKQSLLSTLRAGFPYMVSNVTAQVRLLDVSIVGMFAGSAAAGTYGAASRVVNPFMLIPTTMTALVMPYSARQRGSSSVRTAAILTGLFILIGLALIPAIVFSDQIIGFLFGPQFEGGGPALRYLLISLPFVALSSPLGTILQSQDHEKAVATNGLIFFIVVLLSVVLGALVGGGTGAAVAIGSAYLLKCLSLWIIILFVAQTGSSGRR
jgi:O-antigen/teichoic acid export membrane protein